MSYSASFWEKDSFLKPYDLIVVGAGIVGLSSALFFKQHYPAARIAVLERGFLPQGASTRNAGFACVGSIGEHMADLGKDSEAAVKNRIKRRYHGLQLLKKTLGENAIGYEHCGGFEFFRSREEFEPVAAQIDRFNGWMTDLLDEEVVYEADKLNGYPVIKNRLEGSLHPGKMMQELVSRVSEVGIEIKWNSPVKQATEEGEVELSDGYTLSANKILIAANGFVHRLLQDLDIVPARGYVFVTNELPQLDWKGIFHHDKGYIYFRNVGQRLLIGGARNLDISGEETDEFGSNQKIRQHLVHFVDDILGLQKGWTVDQEWSGIMGFTPTKTPVIKQLDTKRYVAAGLSGMGIAIGMEVGKSAAEMLK